MRRTGIVSRRALLIGRVKTSTRLPPPGATEAGLDACTGCSACVSACPTHIIIMAEGSPGLEFSNGECVFCSACADVCPEPVFSTTRPLAFEHIVQVSDSCLAARGVSCMTCRDACPSNAIRFRPRIGAPFLPEVLDGSCTGCGACIAPCPAAAISVAPKSVEKACV
jgi:ferredoxin-type protein NapF